jgi:hypothetical protein
MASPDMAPSNTTETFSYVGSALGWEYNLTPVIISPVVRCPGATLGNKTPRRRETFRFSESRQWGSTRYLLFVSSDRA